MNGEYLLYRIGFIIEQALGHVTHGQNLQALVLRDPTIRARWALPGWEATGLAGRVPNWTVRAGLQARRGAATMAQEGVDVLFWHTQVTAMLAPDWLRRIPSVVSLDATPRQYDRLGAFYDHTTAPGWLESWKWRLHRRCFHAAQHLVTWSEWTKQGLVDEYEVPPEKVTVIPPGVDTAAWQRPQPRNGRGDTVKILFVGGNLARKGGLLLLEAFRHLRAEAGAAVELHLVTRDAVTPEAGLFVYNDMEPNSARLRRLYHDSDIFCLPTLGDCLPMVLSEAGAAGLPSVTTRVAAIPEIVRDGETGILTPPGDPASLTAALRTLIQSPELRRCQGERAVATVRRDFDAERNALRLLTLLKETAAAPASEGKR